MGRATILSGGDDGLYQIEVDLGQARKAEMIASINADIAKANANIAAADLVLSAATSETTAAISSFNAAIEAYVLATQESTDPATLKDEIAAYEAAFKVMREKQAAMYLAQINYRNLVALKAELVKRLGAVQSITDTLTRSAWCADLTEEATGTVATLEVPGEQNLIIIQPTAPAPAGSDGQLTARGIQTPEQVYFNAATLPGWQKWMPLYRTGTITAIDYEADTADVTLDAAISSAQGLGVNLQTELPACPVEYMTCNAAAFEEGDHVVVRFDTQLWSGQRTVIGFVDNPKPCIDWPATISATLRWQSTVGSNASTTVTVEEGDVIWNCTPNGYSLPGFPEEISERDGKFVLEAVAGLGGIFTASGITPGDYLEYHSTGFFTQNPATEYSANPPGGGLTSGLMYEPRAGEFGGDENIELLKMETTWPIVGPLSYASLQLIEDDLVCTHVPEYDTASARVSPQFITRTTELGPTSVIDFLTSNSAAGTTLTLTHIDSEQTKDYAYTGATRGAGLNWQATWTRVDP